MDVSTLLSVEFAITDDDTRSSRQLNRPCLLYLIAEEKDASQLLHLNMVE